MTDRTCSVEGCERKCVARGWCKAHWNRWRATGDTGSAEIGRHERGRTCSIEGCDRKHMGRGWCAAHYLRWHLTGDPGDAKISRDPLGTCAADGCERPALTRGWCDKHYRRWLTTGDAATPISPRGIGEDAGYMTVHQRLWRRGTAAVYACVRCGAPAKEWAYDHADPNEKQDTKTGFAYSTDLSHYLPMCIPHHRRLDAKHG